jgi:hypothetical protein
MLLREKITVCCENHTNTQVHSVGRMQGFSMLIQVIHTVTTGLERVILPFLVSSGAVIIGPAGAQY